MPPVGQCDPVGGHNTPWVFQSGQFAPHTIIQVTPLCVAHLNFTGAPSKRVTTNWLGILSWTLSTKKFGNLGNSF